MMTKKMGLFLSLALLSGGLLGKYLFNNAERYNSKVDPMDTIISEMMNSRELRAKVKTSKKMPSVEEQREQMLERFKRENSETTQTLSKNPLLEFLANSDSKVEHFDKALSELLVSIPTIQDIQELPAQEQHHMPRPLEAIGLMLGDLKTILNERADFFESGLAFYRECAQTKKFASSIRSLCLANLIEYGDEVDNSALEERYPRNIVELARQAVSWP